MLEERRGVSGGLRADEIAPACALHGLIDHRFGLGRCHAVVLELGVHAQAMEEASQALLRAGEVGAENLLQGSSSPSRPQARPRTIGKVNEQAMPWGRPWRKVIS